jgi:siroheme synthase
LVIATHHYALNESAPDSEFLIEPRTTFALYMPGTDYGQIAEQMHRSGLSGETPCLIASRASTSQQLLCRTSLRELARVPPSRRPR